MAKITRTTRTRTKIIVKTVPIQNLHNELDLHG
jgi:hypothetical protein